MLPLLLVLLVEARGNAAWPTKNHFRERANVRVAAGVPVAIDLDLAAHRAFNPDSVRVFAGDRPIPAKTEWRTPKARVSFASAGPGDHFIYFDLARAGETERLVAPAMVGTGDRVTYGGAGVRGKLAGGLWAHPAPVDIDDDGDVDLIVGCADRPYNGIYLFRNLGDGTFDRAEWLGPGKKDLVAADFNGDGRTDLVYSGGYFSDVKKNLLAQNVAVKLDRKYHIGRDDLWHPADWDGDGKIDLLVGVSDWRDYGWDDAFDENGRWLRGPLHGRVWLHRNTGTNANPVYAEPVDLGFDTYGSPAPNPVDWFGTGRLDLVTGSFVDWLDARRRQADGSLAAPVRFPFRLDLCMIQPRVAYWRAGRGPSLLVAEEDGTISLFENENARGSEPKLAAERKLIQIDPYVKSGALSRPVTVDWNGDGKLDLVSGNSAGYIQWFENTGSRDRAEFTDRGYLEAAGKVIRRIAGPNGSVQGPAEEKWGYSNPVVADWDLDGQLDLLVNDIWGDPVWYRRQGAQLEAARPIEVEWTSAAPKPDWVWWQPKGKQLLTQWRTTPKVVDWDRDGLPDLVMLNHQGYLCLFRRYREAGQLKLKAPERIFLNAAGRFLNLANGRAGASGRRKIEFADLDADGDLDLITDSDDGPVWQENVGTQAKPVMAPRGLVMPAKLPGHNPTPNAADWNGDGKLDWIIGAEDGFFYFFDGRYLESQRGR